MSDAPTNTVLWALVVAAYQLEKLNPKLPTELDDIRKMLSMYNAETVSTYFLKAAITFGKPIVLVRAITACWISSGVAPAASARRAWLCTAPSERIAAAAASCTRCRVFSGKGPASAAA